MFAKHKSLLSTLGCHSPSWIGTSPNTKHVQAKFKPDANEIEQGYNSLDTMGNTVSGRYDF